MVNKMNNLVTRSMVLQIIAEIASFLLCDLTCVRALYKKYYRGE
jgi:hypothetical protein